MPSSNEQASQLIEATNYMSLATADDNGRPHSSTLFYNYDDNYRLYWVSSRFARHSLNIIFRPEVSISLFGPRPSDGKHDGVFIEAEAEELNEASELPAAIEVMQQRVQPNKFLIKTIADVQADSAWRIYRAIPLEISKRRDEDDIIDGRHVTVRETITL